MVDTDMQAAVRDAPSIIPEYFYKPFVQAFAEGKLVQPEEPGHVIAALALQADKLLSGQFLSWDSGECTKFRAK